MRWVLCLMAVVACGAGPESKSAPQWEYGQFTSTISLHIADWHSPDKVVSASTVKGLYEKIGGTKKGELDGSIIDVLNLLGSQGWELVTVIEHPDKYEREYLLKREKK